MLLLSSQENIMIGEYQFPIEPIISVSLTKQIIETTVPGRKGTIKELIKLNDAEINIKGVFTTPFNPNPFVDTEEELLSEVTKLKDLFLEDTRQLIISKLLSSLDIEFVVLKSIDFPEVEGSDMRPFSITLIEDSELMEFE